MNLFKILFRDRIHAIFEIRYHEIANRCQGAAGSLRFRAISCARAVQSHNRSAYTQTVRMARPVVRASDGTVSPGRALAHISYLEAVKSKVVCREMDGTC